MLIRNKLMVWFTAMVASLLIIFSFFIYYFYALYRKQEFADRLNAKASIHARVMLRNHADPQFNMELKKLNLTSLDSERVEIYNDQRILIYRNLESPSIKVNPKQFARIKNEHKIYWNDKEREVLGMLYIQNEASYFVVASAIDHYGYGQLKTLQYILIAGNFIGWLLVAFSGWLFAGAALKPISKVMNEVDEISGTNLEERVDEGNKQDEIARLAVTFNKMLKRIFTSYQSQKNFISNASHELRTPLAVILSELETSYLYDKKAAEHKKSIQSATEEIKKLIRLTNGLLNLAKVEDNPDLVLKKDLLIGEVLDQAIHDTQKVYPLQLIHFGTDNDHTLKVHGHEDLLKTAFSNIIDNACKYSFGEPVEIFLKADAHSKVLVVVKDKGTGIQKKDLAHIIEPLYRGENVKHIAGFGVGLPLACNIIRLHRGEINFFSILQKGTDVTIILPSVS